MGRRGAGASIVQVSQQNEEKNSLYEGTYVDHDHLLALGVPWSGNENALRVGWGAWKVEDALYNRVSFYFRIYPFIPRRVLGKDDSYH